MSDDEWDGTPLDLSADPCVKDTSGSYIWCYCPLCGQRNWLYLGRRDDETAPTAEALRCWSCGKLSWLDKSFRDEAACNGSRLEDAFDEPGREHIA